jgi:hypothetical protein
MERRSERDGSSWLFNGAMGWELASAIPELSVITARWGIYWRDSGMAPVRTTFEETITPVLYAVPDRLEIRRVVIASLFEEAQLLS